MKSTWDLGLFAYPTGTPLSKQNLDIYLKRLTKASLVRHIEMLSLPLPSIFGD